MREQVLIEYLPRLPGGRALCTELGTRTVGRHVYDEPGRDCHLLVSRFYVQQQTGAQLGPERKVVELIFAADPPAGPFDVAALPCPAKARSS